jgi:hypothetical protein
MAQVVEVPELEPWFLVHWRSTTHPDVLMEFETQDEAEGALCAAFAEMAVRAGDEIDVLPMTVCPGLTMLEQPELAKRSRGGIRSSWNSSRGRCARWRTCSRSEPPEPAKRSNERIRQGTVLGAPEPVPGRDGARAIRARAACQGDPR